MDELVQSGAYRAELSGVDDILPETFGEELHLISYAVGAVCPYESGALRTLDCGELLRIRGKPNVKIKPVSDLMDRGFIGSVQS